MVVNKSHPRYESLRQRDLLVEGIKKGITSQQGLIAHGRGEAFDYLLGEITNGFAIDAIKAAAAMLVLAKYPVISVNGNVAVLVAKEIGRLEKLLDCKVEANVFHKIGNREGKIKNYMKKNGVKDVLTPDTLYLKDISHNRRFVNKKGIMKADVVLVPLEDGDRCEALKKSGKKVITIDLNPMSRTARKADITIVDNIARVMPILIEKIREFKRYDEKRLKLIIKKYNNKKILKSAEGKIRSR